LLIVIEELAEQLALNARPKDDPVAVGRGVERVAEAHRNVRLLVEEVTCHDGHRDVGVAQLVTERKRRHSRLRAASRRVISRA